MSVLRVQIGQIIRLRMRSLFFAMVSVCACMVSVYVHEAPTWIGSMTSSRETENEECEKEKQKETVRQQMRRRVRGDSHRERIRQAEDARRERILEETASRRLRRWKRGA